MAAKNNITRRRFFAGLGMITVAGVAAKLTPRAVVLEAASPADLKSASYRITEHIKKYYRTAII